MGFPSVDDTVQVTPADADPGKTRRSRRRLTVSTYEALLEAYRKSPGNHGNAAKAAGVDPATARRGWHEGWSSIDWAKDPIKVVVEREAETIRARLNADLIQKRQTMAAAMAEQREKAIADTMQAREQEAQMVRLARNDIMQQLAVVARLLPGMQELAKKAVVELAKKDISPQQVISLARHLAHTTDSLAAAADRCMQMERRVLGQPETIVGLQLQPMALAEAEEHIEAGARALRRLKERGLDVLNAPLAPPASSLDGITK